MKTSILEHRIKEYNELARKNGLPLYADPVPMEKISDLLKPDRPVYMTDAERAQFIARALEDVSHTAELLFPLAKMGDKFNRGRKPGTGGPIRKAIARLLAKNSAMKNAELWAAIAAKPPKGWAAMDNRIGRYWEGPQANDHMGETRFKSVASEERGKLKAKISGLANQKK